MITVVLVIHLVIATAMVGVILIQRSEGGALSGLGGGTMGGLMTARGTANLLTRATAILATCFVGTSLILAIMAGHSQRGGSILDQAPPPLRRRRRPRPRPARRPRRQTSRRHRSRSSGSSFHGAPSHLSTSLGR